MEDLERQLDRTRQCLDALPKPKKCKASSTAPLRTIE